MNTNPPVVGAVQALFDKKLDSLDFCSNLGNVSQDLTGSVSTYE